MPFRGLLAGVIVLALLGGLVFWSNRTKGDAPGATPGAEQTTEILSLNDAHVQRIEVTLAGQPPAVLRRKGGGAWEMEAPEPLRLDQEAVGSLAGSLAKVSAQRIVEEKPSDLTEFGLKSPRGVVAATMKDGTTSRLLLGDETPTGGGVFAKLDAVPRVFTLTTAVRDALLKGPQDLRDKRLLTFDPAKLTSLVLTSGGRQIELGRDGRKEWQLTKPVVARADNLQIGELIRNLQEARMTTAPLPESTNASAFPSYALVASAVAVDPAGSQRLEVRRNPKDNTFHAKSSIVEGVHLVSDDLGKAIAKSADDLRNKKLFDFGFDQPGRVELVEGTNRYIFEKKEKTESWISQSAGPDGKSQGKKMDTVGVQSLIDKLRDLTATSFATGGFGLPYAAEFSVTSDAQKRVERVQISRSGTTLLAKREGEPTIYQLDSKALDDLLRAARDVKPDVAQAAAK